MMGLENRQEWQSSAWVELETVRATIEAYGRSEIELPHVSKSTRKDRVSNVDQRSDLHYTRLTVAQFLGWIRNARG
jgi:hypothetical protein